MPEGDIEFLGRRLINELGIQPWPRPWERREILREHLRTVKVPANVLVDQWHTAKASTKWQGPILTKTQKRRLQRIQAEARHHLEKAKGMRSNVWNRLKSQPSLQPMKNDYEAGSSRPVPWLQYKIEQWAPSELTEKVTQKALEEKIASLETIIK
uniref:Uncharacterized protein n=1 Tax=Ananas comosus var. bracteatus TaxID=296719 RepID=A0A6V7NSH2_ANACO|nr:unnamed protein product [Ananas comosus var. bracteatus]